MQQLIESLRLQYLWEEIVGLIRNPYANITASLLLLAAVVIFVLLVALTVIAIVTRPGRRQLEEDAEELRYLLAVLGRGDATFEEAIEEAEPPTLRQRIEGYPWLTWLAVAVAALFVGGVAVGGSSASSGVCVACHENTSHSETVTAGGTDPHFSVACVRCHEASGWLGSLSIEVPQRLLHVVNGIRTKPRPTPYGVVVSAACRRCHRSIAAQITEDEARGVRMAHKQPLDADADCLDCHTLSTGVVSSLTVGMAPCLRCHDGENQPTKCSLCHTKDVSVATRSRGNLAQMKGRSLIPTPDCGGCHDEATQCDPCHGGVRMPHSELFLWWGHAREGAKDVWFSAGQKCARCHTAERRPCTKCHAYFPGGHPIEFWVKNHGNSGDVNSCDQCHGNKAYVNGRDFCKLCHGEPLITQ